MLEDIHGYGNDIASYDRHQAELDEAIATPYAFEVFAREHQCRDRKDELSKGFALVRTQTIWEARRR